MELVIFLLVILVIVLAVIVWDRNTRYNDLYMRYEELRNRNNQTQSYEDYMAVRAAEAIANGTYPDPYSQFRKDPETDEENNISAS